MGLRIQNRWCGGPVRCAGLVPWSRGPVWPPSGPVPRPQPGLGHGSQDPESVVRRTRSVCPGGPVVPWSRGPVNPSGLSLSSSLFAVWGPRSGIIYFFPFCSGNREDFLGFSVFSGDRQEASRQEASRFPEKNKRNRKNMKKPETTPN